MIEHGDAEFERLEREKKERIARRIKETGSPHLTGITPGYAGFVSPQVQPPPEIPKDLPNEIVEWLKEK